MEFEYSDKVKALQAKGQLTAQPTVTLLRQGGETGAAKPTVGQIYLMEQ